MEDCRGPPASAKWQPKWMQIGPACVNCGSKRRPVARRSLSNPSSSLNRLDFACAGGLQQSEALAGGLLRILIALPFVLDFQARPFIRVDGPEVGSFELAIGGGLWRQQRQVWPPDFWCGMSIGFGVSTG